MDQNAPDVLLSHCRYSALLLSYIDHTASGHPYPQLPIDSLALQRRGDRIPDGPHIRGGFESRNHPAVAVNQELRKIPFDIGLVAECFVVHVREFFQRGILHPFAKTLERFLQRKKRKQGLRLLAVYICSSGS